ncbi:MAG: hypothetical protein JRF53_16520, partial [Deltaproteobacteria bacterium]|nr:hypothetical protein [Deltaproteobacteria bacterium]
KKIEDLRKLVKVQTSDGNWNYSEYMLGMANGMLCALSVISGEEPNYLDRPDEWLCDKDYNGLECVVSSECSGSPTLGKDS